MHRICSTLGRRVQLGGQLAKLPQRRAVQRPASAHVVVDALNFLDFFTPVREPQYCRTFAPWPLFDVTKRRVALFLRGCSLSGLQPHFVFDTGNDSDEAIAKWEARREREIISEDRSIPAAADVVLMALLRAHGADVIQPLHVDADDVVARLAMEWDALILSSDRDMLRYTDLDDKERRVHPLFAFHSFVSDDGRIELLPRIDFQSRSEPRIVAGMELDLAAWRQPFCKLDIQTIKTHGYVRGNTDAFTKQMGNLHKTSRPLRQALYARLGIETVFERLPVWDEKAGSVVWEDCSVNADARLDALLDDEAKAFEWLEERDTPPATSNEFGDPGLQEEHLCRRSHSRAMVVAECLFSVRLASQSQNEEPLPPLECINIAERIDPFAKCSGREIGKPLHPLDSWSHSYIADHLIYEECSNFGCGRPANCDYGELQYLWKKNFTVPKRCRWCRKQAKKDREGSE